MDKLNLLNQKHFGSLVILFFFLSWSFLYIWSHVTEALWQTLLLEFVITCIGLLLINSLSVKLNDVNLQKLGYVFLLKLTLVLIILNLGWVPYLDPSDEIFGFDPQRYYFDANELAQNNFSLDSLPGINYVGILFYYGIIFSFIGHNPIIPALLNTFTTLIATLLLIKIGYLIKQKRDANDWILGLVMMVPEVLWFDVMTSRETIVMSLILISIYLITDYYINKTDKVFLKIVKSIVFIFALILIGLIRTSILIPVFISIVLFSLFLNKQKLWHLKSKFFVLLSIAGLIFMPFFSEKLGGSEYSYFNLFFEPVTDKVLNLEGWSEQSIGKQFISNNIFETILYAPIRLIFYLVAPLPNISFSLIELFQGSSREWGTVLPTLSSVLYVLLFPLAIASLIQIFRRKNLPRSVVFHIPFWVTMITISSGTQIIHERYRVMAIPLLWGCVWLGRTCDIKIVRQVYLFWGGLLMFGGVLFISFKNF